CGDVPCPIRRALKVSKRPPPAAACDLAYLVAAVSAHVRVGRREVDLERLAARARRQTACEYVELADRARLSLLDAAATGLDELVHRKAAALVSAVFGSRRVYYRADPAL